MFVLIVAADVDLKKYAVQFMHQTGSMEYTRQALRELKSQVCAEIERLGEESLDAHWLVCFAWPGT